MGRCAVFWHEVIPSGACCSIETREAANRADGAQGSCVGTGSAAGLVLQQLDLGQTAAQVGLNLSLSSKAVRAIALRFEQEGLEGVLYEKQRPGRQRVLHESQSQ